MAVIGFRFGAVPTDFVPWWNDEVVYWNEVAGFGRAGLDTGYVAVSGQTPSASFSRFGPHGPAYTVFYGSIARMFGWHTSSAFIVNMLLAIVGVAGWFLARGRDAGWGEALLIATFWPLLLYLPTHMQEPMHIAIALGLAAAAWRLRTTARPALVWAWAAPLLLFASLARPTWGLVLLALDWPRVRRGGPRRIALVAAATLTLTGCAQIAFAWLAAPFPYKHSDFLSEMQVSWSNALDMVVRWSSENLQLLLSPVNGELPEIVFRYVVFSLAAALATVAWRARARHDDSTAVTVQGALIALLAPLPLTIAFGSIEAWRDFRVLAPHVLLALLLAGAVAPRVRWLWFATLLATPQVYQTFEEFHDQRFRDSRAILEEARSAVTPVLSYTPGAEPWHNTVLVTAGSLELPLLAIPPGVSLSYVIDWADEPMPPLAKYLWLKDAERDALESPLRLMPLAVTSGGTLYLNLDAP